MGGEPTFVSIDDMDGAEWNTAARRARPSGACADDLIAPAARPLRARRPAALRPGQVVSGRAAAALGVRAATGARDGEPLWHDASADRRRDATHVRRTRRRRERFIGDAARRARRRPPTRHSPAYEDTWLLPVARAAAAGQRRPAATPSWTIAMERARLRARLRAGPRPTPVGYVLPLQRVDAPRPSARWSDEPLVPARRAAVSCCPAIRRSGFRLPLDSLPWVAESDCPTAIRRGSVRAAAPLPPERGMRQRCGRSAPAIRRAGAIARRRTPPRAARTDPRASCAPRSASSRATGTLYVFMPPVETHSRTTSTCVAAIEATAADARTCRCVIEGYPPPRRPAAQRSSRSRPIPA